MILSSISSPLLSRHSLAEHSNVLSRLPDLKNLLALIYLGRTVAAAAFILMPITPLSVIIFSVVMGSLWLATVPLTSGLVGYIQLGIAGRRNPAGLYPAGYIWPDICFTYFPHTPIPFCYFFRVFGWMLLFFLFIADK